MLTSSSSKQALLTVGVREPASHTQTDAVGDALSALSALNRGRKCALCVDYLYVDQPKYGIYTAGRYREGPPDIVCGKTGDTICP